MSKSVRTPPARSPARFFRREGRPSTEAILVCRLIDRPLRPTFVEGLRNEVQIVITVLSIAPDEFYDALAINAASASTQISGLPFYGPVGGIRLASSPQLGGHQWVAFPKFSQLEEAVFDLTVAGRLVTDNNGNEDVAIMMVEAEATEGSWDLIQAGATKPDEAVVARASRRPSRSSSSSSRRSSRVAAQSAKPIADFPLFPPYEQDLRRRRRLRLRRAQGRLPDRRQGGAPGRRRRTQGPRQGGRRRQDRGRAPAGISQRRVSAPPTSR